MVASKKAKLSVVTKKDRYHHGDLREALISAAQNLISERGVDGFTLTDASRAAGVSTAAPYRHFSDREDLIDAVVANGFEILTGNLRRAYNLQIPGSISAITALGKVYVKYAAEDPAMFHVMWGHARTSSGPEEDTDGTGAAAQCFGVLTDAVQAFQERNALQDVRTEDIATPIWAMVHGTASLMMGGALSRISGKASFDEMITSTTRNILLGLIADHGANRHEPLQTGRNPS